MITLVYYLHNDHIKSHMHYGYSLAILYVRLKRLLLKAFYLEAATSLLLLNEHIVKYTYHGPSYDNPGYLLVCYMIGIKSDHFVSKV